MATSDGYAAFKADEIVDGALGLLERRSVLGNTVTRDGFGNYTGAKNDTVNLRVEAYAKAGTRDMRSATNRTRTKLHERVVPVVLNKNVNLDVPLTDEELSLDIENLARQVIGPAVRGVAREIETALGTLMGTATYANQAIEITGDPYDAIVDARKVLADMQVPTDSLWLACGSSVEAEILKSDHLARFDHAGDANALRRAEMGRIANATAFGSQALDPEIAVLYISSAFALPNRAPIVPEGAPWGASRSVNGYSIRVMQALDAADVDGPTNVVFHDTWYGLKAVTDVGAIDETTGKFEPAVDPEESGADDLFVRAVKLELGS